MPLINIKIAYAILITSATGTIFLLFGLFAGKFLDKAGYLNVGYKVLRCLALTFILPLVFVILMVTNENSSRWGGLLFLHTRTILIISSVFLLIWCIAMIIMIVMNISNERYLKKVLGVAFECNVSTNRLLERMCEELNIPKGKVHVKKCYMVPSPVIVGTKDPMILLALDDYTESEIKAIFYHELYHYKHRDLHFKKFLHVICALNFFNPFVWWYRRIVVQWMELACDDCARVAFGDTKAYAIALTEIASKENNNKNIISGGSVSQKPLAKRIIHMLEYTKIKKKSKGVAALLVAVSTLLGTTGATAVAGATADQYVNLYNNTCVEVVEEETVYEPGVEYVVENWSDEGVIIEEGEVEGNGLARGATMLFDWTVEPGVLKKGPSYYCTSGQGMQVSCLFTPTTQSVRIGILEPDGTKRFLQTSSGAYHTFSLTKTGYYYVFVENISSYTTITAEGHYRSIDQ